MEDKYNIVWLDDVRSSEDDKWKELILTSISNLAVEQDDLNIIWIKSYEDFVTYIENNVFPYMVCFDHDLGKNYHWKETHPLNEDGTTPDEHEILYDQFAEDEKTGYHATKWLCDYCRFHEKKFPKYIIQSSNTVGAENIRTYIENYKKHVEKY